MFFPRIVLIDITLACNAKCVMCPTRMSTRQKAIIDSALFHKIISELKEHSQHVEQVWLGMHGEPFVDVNFAEKVDLCRRYGLKTVISTNGSLVTPERAVSVLDAGAGLVIFSLESLDRQVYEKIRVGLNHSDVVANIKTFLDLRTIKTYATRVLIRCVESELNQVGRQEFTEYWMQYLKPGMDSIEFTPINNWAYGKPGRFYGSTPCRQAIGMATILSDGTVSLCCIDYDGVFKLGNVSEKSILEIMNSDGARKLREIHESGRRNTLKMCRTCYLPELWDGDPAEVYDGFGGMNDMEHFGRVARFECSAVSLRGDGEQI
jgi:radical SAM protein with 4Fe4S-binding SPASM domain